MVTSKVLSKPVWGVHKYGIELIINPKELPSWGDKSWVIDVENNKDGSFALIGLYDGGTIVYCFSKLPENLPQKLIAHNGNTDLHKLKAWGYSVQPLVWDTEIAAYAEDTTAKVGLKDLAGQQAIYYPPFYNMVKKAERKFTLEDHVNSLYSYQYGPNKPVKRLTEDTKWDFQPTELPVELLAEYNAMDCYSTWQVLKQQKQVPDYYHTLDLPLSNVLFSMEERGIRVDQRKLTAAKEHIYKQLNELKCQLENDFGPINLNSPKQLLEALAKYDIHPIYKKKPSTDKKALQSFADNAIVKRLLDYSEVSTLLDSFITPYEAFGAAVIHPWFNQCRTRTTRLACSKPNLQQIPVKTENGKLIRDFIVPATEGLLFYCGDFGQIEPRLMAHLSKDKNMLQMFQEGVNFHSYTAKTMEIERDAAKVLNLSVGYRATKYSVSKQLNTSLWEAQKVISDWWEMFPRLYEWEEQTLLQARKNGYVTTLYGRRIKVDGLDDSNVYKKEHAERQAINNLVQGSASEVNRKALIDLHKNGAPVCLSVHDEVVIEIEPKQFHLAENYTSIMEHCIELDVPLVVEYGIGKSWQEAKPK